MIVIAYNQLLLFLAFVGGLWIGDMFGDNDGNASIGSILVCGIAAIAVGFFVDTYRYHKNKKDTYRYHKNKNKPS